MEEGRETRQWWLTFVLIAVLADLTAAQTWIQLTPTGTPPTPRADASAAYDPVTNRMTVFGGNAFGCSFWTRSLASLNDTWVLTHANGLGGTPEWIPVVPSGNPPPVRRNHTAVYNPATNRMIVFGGDPSACGIGKYNDVWVLLNANGTGGSPAWAPLFPLGGPPPPRSDHSAVYDPLNNSMTIYGGFGPSLNLFDVWVLTNADGSTGTPQWIQLRPTGGPPEANLVHSAIYDVASNRMTVFGGWAGCCSGPYSNDVWVLTNANGTGGPPQWVQLSLNGSLPLPRVGPRAVYDSATKRMIVSGGATALTQLNEVWVLTEANGLNSAQWIPLSPMGTPPLPRGGIVSEHTATYDANTNRMTIFGGITPIGPMNDVWVLTNANGLANHAPLANAGPDQLVSAGPGCLASVTLDGRGSSDPDADPLNFIWTGPFSAATGATPMVQLPVGKHVITLVVSDGKGETASDTVNIESQDTTPPTLTNVPGSMVVEQASPSGTAVSVPLPSAVDPCGPVAVTSDAPSLFPAGTTLVRFTAKDLAGNTASATTAVTVIDTRPPVFDSLIADPNVLWPPNHRMVPVTVTASAWDAADPSPSCRIISVTSTEPINGLSDGDMTPDWEITGKFTLNLRAERSKSGSGRVYAITVQCSDASGNGSTQATTVAVPGDQRK